MFNERKPQASLPRFARYSRQILYENIGAEGQQRLLSARVLLVGCGALGSALAETLVRAGVGFVRICDRDFVERDNLQRQVLFDENDVASNLPKAEAAAAKLRRINSEVVVEPVVVDVNSSNIESFSEKADVLLDGTDNFETRFLINDLAVSKNSPWVYGAVIGATGLCMAIIPRNTPCLRCLFEEAPPPEMSPTCDTAGVLGSTVQVVAGLQAIETMKLLMGKSAQINRHLVSIDVWTGRVMNLAVQSALDEGNCPCCKRGEFPYLRGEIGSSATRLCGRNAVQVNLHRNQPVDFAALAEKLAGVTSVPVRYNAFLLRAEIDGFELTLFPDGRAIIKGTEDADKARALYARYFGA